MSFLQSVGNFFGSKGENSSAIEWKDIQQKEELTEIIESSFQKPMVLYKHSTRCAVSYFALNKLETMEPADAEKADFYKIDVIRQRPLSQHIGNRLDIVHQSPQIIVLRNGEPVWDGSHDQVRAETVLQHIL